MQATWLQRAPAFVRLRRFLQPGSFLVVHHVAHRVHSLTDAAADAPLGLFEFAFTFEVTVAECLAGLLFDGAGRLFQSAFDPLAVHGVPPNLMHVRADTGRTTHVSGNTFSRSTLRSGI